MNPLASATMKTSCLLVLVLFAVEVTPNPTNKSGTAPTMPCTTEFKDEAGNVMASYDLSDLQAQTMKEPAIVSDALMMEHAVKKYTFAVCAGTAPPPACLEPGQPETSAKSQYWAPAWQYNADDKTGCYYLGSTENEGADGSKPWYTEHTKWSLIDDRDPAFGVSLTYFNGEHCTDGSQRQINLNFTCVKHGAELIKDEYILEHQHCGYTLVMNSHLACPTECGYGAGRTPCGEQGVCGYDSYLKKSRCFCNQGFTGSGCGDKVEEPKSEGGGGTSGSVIGLLVVLLLVLIGFGVAGYFFFRWMQGRTISMSGDSYTKLEAAYGDSMTGSSEGPARVGVNMGHPEI